MKNKDSNGKLKLISPQIGEINANKNNVIRFTQGLLGFEEYKQFIIVGQEECKPFRWLVSVDDPSLSLPIVNPQLIDSDYQIELNPNEQRELGLSQDQDALIVSIVTVNEDTGKVTANLKSPVVINWKKKLGRQVILPSEKYSTYQPVLYTSET